MTIISTVHHTAPPRAVTILAACYQNTELMVWVDAAMVDEVVAEIASMSAAQGRDRSAARHWLVDALRTNKHLEEGPQDLMARTILWLACTGEGGELATETARQGGNTIAYEITTGSGKKGTWLNFRLIMGASEYHPMQYSPDDFETVGSA